MRYYAMYIKSKSDSKIVARYYLNAAVEIIRDDQELNVHDVLEFFKAKVKANLIETFGANELRNLLYTKAIVPYKDINRAAQANTPFTPIEPPKDSMLSYSSDANPNPKGKSSYPENYEKRFFL